MTVLLFSVICFVVLDIFNINPFIQPIKNHNYIKSVEISQKIIPIEQVKSGLPIYLKIPKININVNIEHVGLTDKGTMEIPKDFTNVAWFNLGPRPGEKGVAVIDGHFGLKNGISPAFNDLHKLNKGDKLYVEDEKGITTTFIVREIKTYIQSDSTSDVFNSKDEKSHLNLITCQGNRDKVKKSYPNRLVVFTDKEIK
ncbi:MAG: class F sortase [Candidatus Gracilibacteria bacterium]